MFHVVISLTLIAVALAAPLAQMQGKPQFASTIIYFYTMRATYFCPHLCLTIQWHFPHTGRVINSGGRVSNGGGTINTGGYRINDLGGSNNIISEGGNTDIGEGNVITTTGNRISGGGNNFIDTGGNTGIGLSDYAGAPSGNEISGFYFGGGFPSYPTNPRPPPTNLRPPPSNPRPPPSNPSNTGNSFWPFGNWNPSGQMKQVHLLFNRIFLRSGAIAFYLQVPASLGLRSKVK